MRQTLAERAGGVVELLAKPDERGEVDQLVHFPADPEAAQVAPDTGPAGLRHPAARLHGAGGHPRARHAPPYLDRKDRPAGADAPLRDLPLNRPPTLLPDLEEWTP